MTRAVTSPTLAAVARLNPSMGQRVSRRPAIFQNVVIAQSVIRSVAKTFKFKSAIAIVHSRRRPAYNPAGTHGPGAGRAAQPQNCRVAGCGRLSAAAISAS